MNISSDCGLVYFILGLEQVITIIMLIDATSLIN